MPKREKHIIRRSLAEAGPDRTDHRRVRALTDEDIERAVASDPDAAPLLDAAWFASARAVMPPEKEMISIRLDKDVLTYFRSLGPGYQTRINALLRALMERARNLTGAKRGGAR
jgi:uncharacterized protein (DUF4415 family)